MEFKENETKIIHKTYGEGTVVKQYSDTAITIAFSKVGEKNMSLSAFDSGLLKFKEDESSNDIQNEAGNIIQFDTSSIQIGEKNVLEAMDSKDCLIFNESYTVLGDELKAKNIYACYNLTVIGNMSVDTIQVNGSLTVIGDVKADRVNCQKSLYCENELNVKIVETGGDLIADSIICSDLYCGGNVIAKTTVDVVKINVEKNIVAGEGIIGNGEFSAQNAVAGEYFEYDGDISGKIFELETDSEFGNIDGKVITDFTEEDYEKQLKIANELLSREISKMAENDEDDLLTFTMDVTEKVKYNVFEWFDIFARVIDISYNDEIENFIDYMVLEYAKNTLPEEFINYETVEHIFKKPLQEAEMNGTELPIRMNNIEDFLICLKVIIADYEDIGADKEELLDKLFQSVGIKYNTVKSFFSRN